MHPSFSGPVICSLLLWAMYLFWKKVCKNMLYNFSDSIKTVFFSKAKQCACPSHGPLCILMTSLVTAEPWLCTSAQSVTSTLRLLTFNNGLTDLVNGRGGLWAKEGSDRLSGGISFNRAPGVKLRSNRRDLWASILPGWFTRSDRTLTLT